MARSRWQEWAENDDNLAVLTAWARAGLTDEEIAKKIGIRRSTLAEWKKKHPSILAALSTGKEFADRMVENSLFRKTQGFMVNVRKAFKIKTVEYDPETGRKVKESEELQLAEETEYIEPDTKAIIFWLKNRRPEDWREKIDQDSGGGEEEGTGIIIMDPVKVREIRESIDRERVEQDGKEEGAM